MCALYYSLWFVIIIKVSHTLGISEVFYIWERNWLPSSVLSIPGEHAGMKVSVDTNLDIMNLLFLKK